MRNFQSFVIICPIMEPSGTSSAELVLFLKLIFTCPDGEIVLICLSGRKILLFLKSGCLWILNFFSVIGWKLPTTTHSTNDTLLATMLTVLISFKLKTCLFLELTFDEDFLSKRRTFWSLDISICRLETLPSSRVIFSAFSASILTVDASSFLKHSKSKCIKTWGNQAKKSHCVST